jgi:hypothetical protein
MWDLDKSIVLLYFSFPLHLEWYFSCKFCLVFLCLCSRERYDPNLLHFNKYRYYYKTVFFVTLF